MNNELATTNNDNQTTESSRAIAEVQGQVMMAKKFPRDTIKAEKRILDACKRIKLAESAIYTYPKGGTRVEGPSIRLAEMICQNWGNIDAGIIELEQKQGESVMMAYAWDLETNTRIKKVFTVKHSRFAQGKVKDLIDPRDIYEMTASLGTRRLRACILAIIPGDVTESAVEECNKTMNGNNEISIAERIKTILNAFEKIGVSQQLIEKRIGHKIDACIPTEVIELNKIGKSIRDGMSKIDAWFEIQEAKTATKATKPTPKKAEKPAQKEDEKQAEESAEKTENSFSFVSALMEIINNEDTQSIIKVCLMNKDFTEGEMVSENEETAKKVYNAIIMRKKLAEEQQGISEENPEDIDSHFN